MSMSMSESAGRDVLGVALGDVLETDAAARASELDRAGVGLRRLVDQREDALRRRESALRDRLDVG